MSAMADIENAVTRLFKSRAKDKCGADWCDRTGDCSCYQWALERAPIKTRAADAAFEEQQDN